MSPQKGRLFGVKVGFRKTSGQSPPDKFGLESFEVEGSANVGFIKLRVQRPLKFFEGQRLRFSGLGLSGLS